MTAEIPAHAKSAEGVAQLGTLDRVFTSDFSVNEFLLVARRGRAD